MVLESMLQRAGKRPKKIRLHALVPAAAAWRGDGGGAPAGAQKEMATQTHLSRCLQMLQRAETKTRHRTAGGGKSTRLERVVRSRWRAWRHQFAYDVQDRSTPFRGTFWAGFTCCQQSEWSEVARCSFARLLGSPAFVCMVSTFTRCRG